MVGGLGGGGGLQSNKRTVSVGAEEQVGLQQWFFTALNGLSLLTFGPWPCTPTGEPLLLRDLL